MNTKGLLFGFAIALQQKLSQAAALRVALPAGLLRFPMPGLFATILLARQAQTSPAAALPAKSVETPDVRGHTVTYAADRLLELGLRVAVTAEQDDANEGSVIRQSPKEGTRVSVGTSVNLVVSLGSDKKKVT